MNASRSMVLVAIAGLCLMPARAVEARRDRALSGDALTASRLLSESQVAAARTIITELRARAGTEPEVRWLSAELAFRDGDYAGALAALTGLADDEIGGEVGATRLLAERSAKITSGFISLPSPEGHFVIHYAPGPDDVIAGLAGEVLDAAWHAIGADLGHAPPAPIRVELLGSPSDLAMVSTLTEAEIETTGTIALSKYGKLMVVSPRATLLGYPWMDTLAHEYVHLVVTEMGHDQVPVWLQEGLARFEQNRWRGPATTSASALLTPSERGLLASALRKNRLVTLDEMHPSMAKLPSQEAAALAYAEVVTLVSYLHSKVGYVGLRKIIVSQAGGLSARRAVTEVLGQPFATVERDWKAQLKTDSGATARTAPRPIRFAHGGRDTDEVGLDGIGNSKARAFARLGGMLRARGHAAAAVIEYGKALAEGNGDPIVAGKLARAQLEAGQVDQAIATATPLLVADPTDPVPAVTLGAAYLHQQKWQLAADVLEVALRVSPFDPMVRCGLAQAYLAISHKAADREQAACSKLNSAAP